jgi:TolB-like protein
MTERGYQFGPFTFDGERKLLLKRGSPVAIGQRCLVLLETLLAAEGRAVSKADLMDAAWQTVNIEESNLSVQIAALRKCLGKSGTGEEWIATVQRVGYQFVSPGGVEELPANEESVATAQVPDRKPSIAVLPFINISSDLEQEYFADGLAEDLITDLSKISGLLVIARHSSFAYKGKPLDIRRIASELGVRYVIEGSVRRAAARVRINTQLIDATANVHVWADRFDCDLADIFEMQDEVVRRIISALADALPSARPPPKRRAPNIEAYDQFVRGRALSMQSPEDNISALPLLERAVELDPGFAEAHAWLAMNLLFGWMYCYREDSRERVLALAKQAVALDPDNADAHVVLGYVLIFNGAGDLVGGRKQFEMALELNQNHADAWMFLADLEVLEGRPEQAVRDGQSAFRLNPHPPSYYYWLFGWILYAAHRYEEVIETLGQGDVRWVGIGSQRLLAAALAQLGRLDEAHAMARLFLTALPQFTVSSWAKTMPFRDSRDRQHFIEGYLKAGLPE